MTNQPKKRKKSFVAYASPMWIKGFQIIQNGDCIHYMHSCLFKTKEKGMKKIRITFEEID